jgi:hypothetical protein
MNEMSNAEGRGLKRQWRLLALAAILALGLVGMGTRSVRGARPSVPFTFSVSGTLSSADLVHVSLAGTGNASHLGNVKSYRASVTILNG